MSSLARVESVTLSPVSGGLQVLWHFNQEDPKPGPRDCWRSGGRHWDKLPHTHTGCPDLGEHRLGGDGTERESRRDSTASVGGAGDLLTVTGLCADRALPVEGQRELRGRPRREKQLSRAWFTSRRSRVTSPATAHSHHTAAGRLTGLTPEHLVRDRKETLDSDAPTMAGAGSRMRGGNGGIRASIVRDCATELLRHEQEFQKSYRTIERPLDASSGWIHTGRITRPADPHRSACRHERGSRHDTDTPPGDLRHRHQGGAHHHHDDDFAHDDLAHDDFAHDHLANDAAPSGLGSAATTASKPPAVAFTGTPIVSELALAAALVTAGGAILVGLRIFRRRQA